MEAKQYKLKTIYILPAEMKFFPGQGKVREFSGWPGKFRKDMGSRGKNQGI